MCIGICMRGFNNCHFKNEGTLSFVFEFIPQILMMLALFGFMDFLIITKWLTDFTGQTELAPSIITTMITMALTMGVPAETDNQLALIGPADDWAPVQTKVMQVMMLIFATSIPIMLCVKPIILGFCVKHHDDHDDDFKRAQDNNGVINASGASEDQFIDTEVQKNQNTFDFRGIVRASLGMEPEIKNEDHSFGELFIHQMIETIEFTLGTISNTASYLRLWALSLAHSQLAKVFYDIMLNPMIASKNIPGMIIGFYMFLGATILVLLVMDQMECFLHTLRLHWVEFNNKFFKGTGIKFQPIERERMAFDATWKVKNKE